MWKSEATPTKLNSKFGNKRRAQERSHTVNSQSSSELVNRRGCREKDLDTRDNLHCQDTRRLGLLPVYYFALMISPLVPSCSRAP